MRLIDADELKEYIRNGDIGCGINDGQSEILDAINEQPTSYDVDKIVEQLESECSSPNDYPGYVIDVELAIEIVKAGGKDGN